jgi:hypothetical protein
LSPPPADAIACSGFAIQDDGRILVPTLAGTLYVIAPAHAPPPGSSPSVLVLAITITVVVAVLAFACVMWCAYRRRRSIARALYYRYRLRLAFLREIAQQRQELKAEEDPAGDRQETTAVPVPLGSSAAGGIDAAPLLSLRERQAALAADRQGYLGPGNTGVQ